MKRTALLVALLCALATLAPGAPPVRGSSKSYDFRQRPVQGIPKEWGRLVNASSFSDGSAAMFFEATDGTLRRVTVKFFSTDVQWGIDVIVIGRP